MFHFLLTSIVDLWETSLHTVRLKPTGAPPSCSSLLAETLGPLDAMVEYKAFSGPAPVVNCLLAAYN